MLFGATDYDYATWTIWGRAGVQISVRDRGRRVLRRLQSCMLLYKAGWINRQQQEIIEYLRTENQVLKELHGRKRIRF